MNNGKNLAIIHSMAKGRQEKIMKVFGERLKQARVKAGYESATKFAHIMGLEPHTYRFYERGKSWPGPEVLVRMCELLDITPNYLLPEAVSHSGRGNEQSQPKQEKHKSEAA